MRNQMKCLDNNSSVQIAFSDTLMTIVKIILITFDDPK